MSNRYEVKYRCAGCGEHTFRVRFRKHDEDIIHWLDTAVKPALAAAHSPLCQVDKCDLMLPINPGSDTVGMPTKN